MQYSTKLELDLSPANLNGTGFPRMNTESLRAAMGKCEDRVLSIAF